MTMLTPTADEVLTSLEEDGIALLPNFLRSDQVQSMRIAFESRLRNVRWNNLDGYEMTTPYRHTVEDVLTLAQGFVDAALHPLVKDTLREYLGEKYELVEAKGWKSLPVRWDFHGWHGDAWYDQKQVEHIPREVKLGIYLTDVTSGFFEYIKGSHCKQAPRQFRKVEVDALLASWPAVQAKGAAGFAFLFDTSGIHRQSVPILEDRCAVFFNYHDPTVPLQKEDVDYYRYHPLLLNTAFLGSLSGEDSRILGFGNKRNYLPAFVREPRYPRLQTLFEALFKAEVLREKQTERIVAKLKRMFRF
jgi:Phytanoyl-CoA dioxygenase (PhyH)